MTEWAKDKLKELLGGVSFVIPSVGAVMDVVKVSGLEGDASVTFVRGKKKCVGVVVVLLCCPHGVAWRACSVCHRTVPSSSHSQPRTHTCTHARRYLFDFVFTLEWEAELDCGKAKGSLKYPDVTPDNDDEYDTLLEVDPLTPPEARPLINAYVKADGDGIQKVVKEKLREFMREFMQF